MKKVIVLAFIAISISATAFAQESTNMQQHSKTHIHQAAKTMYTCTMHPEVMKSKPGKCPKCGMKLVKKKMPMPKSGKTKGMKM